MSRQINRREFLRNSAATGTGFWVAQSAAFAVSKSPAEKLNVACIGVGGKGASDTDACAGENVVALCDADENTLNKKADEARKDGTKKFPGAKKFTDYRKMLDEMAKQIDAVTVSTPDHMHAPAAVHAMSLGKHAFVQKPLTHTVHEARLMARIAREKKLATQMGNQGTSGDGLRSAVDLIQSGGLGKVKEIHVWTNRPVWPQSPNITARPAGSDPVPPQINWDAWLGSAPERPYKKDVYHPFKWRGWWDFGTGALGDMACHTMNLPNMAMKLGTPIAISAESEALNLETFPGWARVVYEFPQRGELPPIKLTWYEGRKDGKLVLPPAELMHGEKHSGSGSLVIGEKGTLYSPDDYGGSWKLLPKGTEQAKFERKLPKSPGHAEEWIRACKGGEAAMSNFPDYAGPMTEMILLGNIAMKAGKRIEYDGTTGQITNDAAANKLITKEYRKGFELKA